MPEPVFHPAISSLLEDDSLTLLANLGIASTTDFAFFFTEPADIAALSTDDGLVARLCSAWQLARSLSDLHFDNSACSYQPPPPSNTRNTRVIAAPAARPKKRAVPPVALMSRAFQLPAPKQPKLSGSTSSPQADDCLEKVWCIIQDTGAENLNFSETLQLLHSPAKELILKTFSKVSPSRVQSLVSVMKRWCAFHHCHVPSELPYWKPTAVLLAQFLKQVSVGGPTAASGCLSSLKWWRAKAGVPFPVFDPIVQAWAEVPDDHIPKGRTPLPIQFFLALLEVGLQDRGTVSSFARWCLLPLVACLRFAHVQRSVHLRIEGEFVLGQCLKGKRSVNHARPPFDWAFPCVVWPHKTFAQQLLVDYVELVDQVGPTLSFLIPDLNLLPRAGLQPDTQWILKPMPISKFSWLLQALLAQLGMPEDRVKDFTSYALRRFLPTVAHIFTMPEEDRLAIGNWCDKPSAQTEVKRVPAVHTMAQRYSHEKVKVSAAIKQKALLQLSIAVSAFGSEEASWDDVRRCGPTVQAVEQELKSLRWQLPSAPASSSTHMQTAPVLQDEVPVSDSTSDEESVVSPVYAIADVAHVAWFVQTEKGALHLLRTMTEGRLVPWCRDLPFDARHQTRGTGLDSSDVICKKCAARCPAALRNVLRAVLESCA